MKRILIIATGGTIASLPEQSGLTPALTGEELVEYVPQLKDLCDFDLVQPMNIDSTNMRPADWMVMRDIIVEAYDRYDGFVIMHGTDTMAYTAAALSYLVQASVKPIVLTGSQQPMANPFTDAKLNVYQSVLYALDDDSHDVSVVFDGTVICGTRAHKQRTLSFNAYVSVNYPPLAIIRNDRIIRGAGMQTMPSWPLMRTYDRLDERVLVLKLTPGLSPSILETLAPSYDAVILETFGVGGIPEREEASWERAVRAWVDSGRFVVVTTQVPEEGLDLGVYEVGRAYANMRGVLRGGDMSTEALVAKTMWALGKSHDPEQVEQAFYRPVNNDRVSE